MYILGIDGGGTHTRAELRDERNTFLRRGMFGPFNLASIGESGFRLRLQEVFAWVGDMGQLLSICVGGAGSSGGAMGTVLQEELDAAGFSGKLTLCGDHEIALAGAIKGPGCILIAGTGSICCGRNAAGETVRCGGWGHLLDDGGSAYAIGRDALRAALFTMDGRLPDNVLHSAVMQRLSASDAADLVRYVYYEAAGKAEIAALAPLVLDTAEQGDPISLDILRSQAKELTSLVQAVLRRTNLQNPPIALLGGLLERDTIYRRLVEEQLSPIAQIISPAHDALWGAAEIAAKNIKVYNPL